MATIPCGPPRDNIITVLKLQVHNYTIGPTNWDHNEVSVTVINSLRGDAITRIVYGQPDGQTDNMVSHNLIS